MTFIFICGGKDVGKSNVCNKLHDRIAADLSFKMHDKFKTVHTTSIDYITHYEKDNKHVILNFAADSDGCMAETCQYLDNLAAKGMRPDIIITTIREIDEKTGYDKYQMSHLLALLEAFANGTPKLEDYFNQNIKDTTSFETTRLGSHAFVLHLKKQKDKNNDALNRYWNYSAETAMQMLDLAIARL